MKISEKYHFEDFTLSNYRCLLRLASQNYVFRSYTDFSKNEKFILWHHDIDVSPYQAFKLAKIEHEEGIKTVYCLHLHSMFYNIFEQEITNIIRDMIKLGHHIGLHFDTAYYDLREDLELLNKYLLIEKRILEEIFDRRIDVFSFHNPTPLALKSYDWEYGGMINAYAKYFREEVGYCSDSNGYWRHRNLTDVLTKAEDKRLHVLTHPVWWQEKPMPPGRRVFRNAYSRAASTMQTYDAVLETFGRTSLPGQSEALRFLKELSPDRYELCDYLWNQGHFASLFSELWHLQERQINQLCKAVFKKDWRVPAKEVNTFFKDRELKIDGWKLFQVVFDQSWIEAIGCNENEYKDWIYVRNQLVHARSHILPDKLEDGCVYMCGIINKLAKWGVKQSGLKYDGIHHMGSIGIPTYKTSEGRLAVSIDEVRSEIENFPKKKWEKFQKEIQEMQS